MAVQSVTKASLAKEIRAVMDSTPNGLDSKQIENDYRSLVGKSLRERVKTLGYVDIDSFLLVLSKEGAVQLEHTSGAYVYRAAVADKSTLHLQALVRNQHKKPKKGEANRRRFGGGGALPSPKKKELPRAMASNLLALVREKRKEIQLCDVLKLYHDRYGANFNFRPYGFSSLKESVCSVAELSVATKGDNVLVSIPPVEALMSSPTYETVREALCKVVTKVLGQAELPLYKFRERHLKVIGKDFDPKKYGFSSLLNLMNDLVETVNLRRDSDTDEWLISHVSFGGPKCTPNQQMSKKKKLPDELMKMVEEVVEDVPCGIYLVNFEQTFKLKKNLDLSPHTYGFESMKALLCSEVLNDKIEIVPAKFGMMIRMKGEKPAEHAVTNSVSDTTQDIHDAVGPGVCYNPAIQPPFNAYIVLIVSQVYSPGSFYVQLMPNDNAGRRLEELMDLLEEVYNPVEASQTYKLPLMFAIPGQLVVCRFPNDTHWHRARITKVIDVNFVQVIFVDYGTRCAIHKTQLFYLRQQFLGLPVQAQPATLFGVSPAVGSTWSAAASKTFLNLTSNKRLCALAKSVDKDQRLSLCLTDTTADVDIHINDYLVTSGFAAFADTSAQLPKHNNSQVDGMLNWSLSSDEESEDEGDTKTSPSTQPCNQPNLQCGVSSLPDIKAPEAVVTVCDQSVGSADVSPPATHLGTRKLKPALQCSARGAPSIAPTSIAPALMSSVIDNATATNTIPPPLMSSVKDNATATNTTPPPLMSSVKDNATATNTAPPPLMSSVKDNGTATNTAPPPLISSVKDNATATNMTPPPLMSSVKDNATATNTAPPPLMSSVKDNATATNTIPPPLMSSVKDNATATNTKIQQTATVRPQVPLHNTIVLAQRQSPVLPSRPHFQQRLYQQQSAMLHPSNVLFPPNQTPVYRTGYDAFNTPYMLPPQPYYPMQVHYNTQYYPQGPYIHPSNFSLHTNLSVNASGQGELIPPLLNVNSQATNLRLPSATYDGNSIAPPVGHSNSEVAPTSDIPALVNVMSDRAQVGPSPAVLNNQPPPLMRVGTGVTSLVPDNKMYCDNIPLVDAQILPTSSSLPAQAQHVNGDQSTTSSAKHLQYKLAGLQLKRKRIQRDKLKKELADYSGAESSDSELSGLEQEISGCKEQLSKLASQGSSEPVLSSCGRGRGRLHLIALASAD